MVAQELAIRLLKDNRILSLYLANTTSGNTVRNPLVTSPSFHEPYFINFELTLTHEKLIKKFVMKNFSTTACTKIDAEKKISELWNIAFDHRLKALTTQSGLYYGHYISFFSLFAIMKSRIPVTCQLAPEDASYFFQWQKWVADKLKAKTVTLGLGHLDAYFLHLDEMVNEIVDCTSRKL